MKIKKLILPVLLINLNYLNIFAKYCEYNDKNNLINKNNNKNNDENDKGKPEKGKENPENNDNNINNKKNKNNLENLLPDKFIYKNSLYKWQSDYCGYQCCCYFLSTLFYNEDEILQEFQNSDIKFLNNIAQIVNDFKNNNYNNKCHELLFNSVYDLFFEIAEKLTLEDFEKKNESINFNIFINCTEILQYISNYKTKKEINTESYNYNNISFYDYITSFNYFKEKEDFLSD